MPISRDRSERPARSSLPPIRLRGSSILRNSAGVARPAPRAAGRPVRRTAMCAMVFFSTLARNRMPLGVIAIEQAISRDRFDYLGSASIPGSPHPCTPRLRPLPAHRRMARARRRRPAGLVRTRMGRGLASHIGEPASRVATVDAEVGPVDARRAPSLRSRRVGSLPAPTLPLGQHDPNSRPLAHGHSAVADLVLRLPMPWADGVWRDARSGSIAQSRPRRSASSSSDPSRGSRCPRSCGSGCVPRRSRRDTARRSELPSDDVTSTPVSFCTKPVTSRPRRSAHQLDRPNRRGCARCASATAQHVVVPGREVADVQRDVGSARARAPVPAEMNRSATPRWSEDFDGARACRPPAREPARSWLARRSTMATSRRPPAPAPAASISPGRATSRDHHSRSFIAIISYDRHTILISATMVPHDPGLTASPQRGVYVFSGSGQEFFRVSAGHRRLDLAPTPLEAASP